MATSAAPPTLSPGILKELVDTCNGNVSLHGRMPGALMAGDLVQQFSAPAPKDGNPVFSPTILASHTGPLEPTSPHNRFGGAAGEITNHDYMNALSGSRLS